MRSQAPGPQGCPTPLGVNRGGASTKRGHAVQAKSGTLIHDLNNLLGVIISANERLTCELVEGSEQQKLALLTLEAADRAAELVGRALALTQVAGDELDVVDCAECLDTVRRMARFVIAPSVRLTVCDPALPLHCLGDGTGLEMALLNLCLNASHATSEGGSIIVEAQRTPVSELEGRRLGLTAGVYVAFTVRDTGTGMSPQILSQATDPLFTTKSAGTGLGLSSVLQVATSAGGRLLVAVARGPPAPPRPSICRSQSARPKRLWRPSCRGFRVVFTPAAASNGIPRTAKGPDTEGVRSFADDRSGRLRRQALAPC